MLSAALTLLRLMKKRMKIFLRIGAEGVLQMGKNKTLNAWSKREKKAWHRRSAREMAPQQRVDIYSVALLNSLKLEETLS